MHGRRILVVDDNIAVAKMQAMLLATLGAHTIDTAHDGPTALELAANFQPDIILLDIGLPRMSGYDVAKRLREQPQFERTVLVALTGYGTDDDAQRARDAGFHEHLVKPVEFGRVCELLRKFQQELQSQSDGAPKRQS